MMGWEPWKLALLAIAGYLAVMSLIQLMGDRQRAIVAELTRQLEVERSRIREKRRRAERKKLRDQLRKRRDQAA